MQAHLHDSSTTIPLVSGTITSPPNRTMVHVSEHLGWGKRHGGHVGKNFGKFWLARINHCMHESATVGYQLYLFII